MTNLRDLKALGFRMHALADTYEANGPAILTNAHNFADGIPAARYDTERTNGGTKRDVGDKLDDNGNYQPGNVVVDGMTLASWCKAMDRLLATGHQLAHILTPRTEAELSTSATCGACSVVVTGAGNDRLRAGYCAACNMAWTRAGRPDRARWEIERRRYLDTPEGVRT